MVNVAHRAIQYSCKTKKMIRMDVAMKAATPSKPIPSRMRSHIREQITLTIDHSSVSLIVVPYGKQHSALLFKLLLFTSIGVM